MQKVQEVQEVGSLPASDTQRQSAVASDDGCKQCNAPAITKRPQLLKPKKAAQTRFCPRSSSPPHLHIHSSCQSHSATLHSAAQHITPPLIPVTNI